MNFNLIRLGFVLSVLVAISCDAAAPVPWDLTGPSNVADQKPDILWRRKSNVDTYLWEMNYTVQSPNILAYANHANTLPSTSTGNWKIVGTGDFDNDTKQDILWQHDVSGLVAVWFMNGPNLKGTASINGTPPGSSWRIVGVGDFGQFIAGAPSKLPDGKPDIVWQDPATGLKSVWLMDGTTWKYTQTIEASSTTWKIVAVADFGSSSTVTTPDGKPDFVLADYSSGLLAIRYMDGYNLLSQSTIMNGGVALTFAFDEDYQVVAAADWAGNDGHPDLLIRHVTDGRLSYWQLNGASYVSEVIVQPSMWDTDWRMDTQDLTDSTWRLTRAAQPILSTSSGVNAITLTPLDYPLGTGQTYTIERAPANGTFTTLQSGATTAQYIDSTVAANTAYDYRVTRVGGSGGVATTRAIFAPSIIESRGRVLVVVDNTLYAQPSFAAYWQTFQQDLAGDGWEVVTKTDARRHHDAWDTWDKDGVLTIKNWIVANSSGAKAVILLGHVVLPYSGLTATDGHVEHAQAWAADMYYGDTDGNWVDSGNGQFTNDFAPSAIELAVGRIDFARLTAFGVTDGSSSAAGVETTLVQNYLTKAHNYRYKLAPFPLADRALSMISWYPTIPPLSGLMDLQTKQVTSDIYNGWSGKLFVGDPLRNSSPWRDSTGPIPHLFAFAAGNGNNDAIYGQRDDLLARTDPVLKNATSGPAAAFWFLNGSIFADINFAPNNLPRAILATGASSLVVLASSTVNLFIPNWSMSELAWGKTIGDAFVTTMNYPAFSLSPRGLNIQGDPTLRLNSVSPPSLAGAAVSGSNVLLTWSGGETTSYYIYRAAASNGPFTFVTSVTGPQTGYSVVDAPSKRYYMVRCGKSVNSGRVSYTSLSQGSIKQAL